MEAGDWRRWVAADEQQGAAAELRGGAGAFGVKFSGSKYGGRSSVKTIGGSPRRETAQLPVAVRRGVILVEEQESRLHGLPRPIRLRRLQHRRKEREEVESWGIFFGEQGIASGAQAELAGVVRARASTTIA